MSSESVPDREPAAVRGQAPSRHPGWRELGFSLKRIFKNPLTSIGLAIILFFVVLAVFALWFAPLPGRTILPHAPRRLDMTPPPSAHPLGTLPSQYDILYGVIWGTRNAFRIGLAVVAANLVMGLVLGAIAGYFGGLVDEIIMRVGDIFYAIPTLVMAMALVIALGRGLQSIVLVLIILNWPTYTRMIRAEILVVRNMDYIQAARVSGASHLRSSSATCCRTRSSGRSSSAP
jgi:peptide/nickel transport system permease protein